MGKHSVHVFSVPGLDPHQFQEFDILLVTSVAGTRAEKMSRF